MSDLKLWNNAAGNNNSASPNGWPEGMSPSGVNDSGREMMAAVRRWYESAEWIDLGITPTYASTTSFTMVGDQTGVFHANRRVKCSDVTTLYGTISSATYSANTRVSVTLDSGNLSASLSGVAVGILSFNNNSLPTGLPSVKIIQIGTWNMNALRYAVVVHGLTLSKIRSISAIVYSDTNNVYIFNGYNGEANNVDADSIYINLDRAVSGFFNSTNFQSTASNRGWVTIQYIPYP